MGRVYVVRCLDAVLRFAGLDGQADDLTHRYAVFKGVGAAAREVVRIVVEFRRRSLGWRSDGNGPGDLLTGVVLRGGEKGVALDGDDELGEVAVADDAPELLLGDEHAGGGPALRMSPSRQHFTLRWV